MRHDEKERELVERSLKGDYRLPTVNLETNMAVDSNLIPDNREPLTLQPPKPPATTLVELTDKDLTILADALETHAHAVSEAPGVDLKTKEYLQDLDRLSNLLGGDSVITFCEEEDCTNEAVDEDGYCEDHMDEEPSDPITPVCFVGDCQDDAVKNNRCARHQGMPSDLHKKQVGTPEECRHGAHDFEVRSGFKVCELCMLQEPFPNTRDGLLNFMQAETERMLTIARAKNQDYAGAASDPFANFTRVEALGICTPEVGFLTRMSDKLSRIASITSSGKTAVKDESVKDTLRDLANYSLLMLAYIESKKDGAL